MQRQKMEQIQLLYSHSEETVTAMMMLYKITKAMVCSYNGDIDFFNIFDGVLQGNTISVYNLLRLRTTDISRSNKRKKPHIKKTRDRRYPTETMIDTHSADA